MKMKAECNPQMTEAYRPLPSRILHFFSVSFNLETKKTEETKLRQLLYCSEPYAESKQALKDRRQFDLRI
jgi:hypothetical protein